MKEPSFPRLRTNIVPRLLALAVIWGGLSAASWAHLPPGTMAPDFELPLLDQSGSVALSKIEGVRLLVMVRSDQRFTSDVVQLLAHLETHKALEDNQALKEAAWTTLFVWMGGDKASIPALPQRPGSRHKRLVVHDSDGSKASLYNVIVSPTIYLVDEHGKIEAVFAAWSPQLESKLIHALQQLTAGKAAPAPAVTPFHGYNHAERADMCFRAARNMEAHKSWESALAFYERGLTYEPGNVEALAAAAGAALNAGEPAKAKELAQKVLAIQPDHAAAKKTLGDIESRAAERNDAKTR